MRAKSSVAPAAARTKEEMLGAIPLMAVEPMMTEKRTLQESLVSQMSRGKDVCARSELT